MGDLKVQKSTLVSLDWLDKMRSKVELSTLPEEAFCLIADEIWSVCQYKLLTFTLIESIEDCTVRRVWSSDLERYPMNGTKSHPDPVWLECVLVNKKYFLCRNKNEIKKYMFDYETIIATGAGSLLNLPIICLGRVLGTININCDENYFTEDVINQLKVLGSLAIGPAMMLTKFLVFQD